MANRITKTWASGLSIALLSAALAFPSGSALAKNAAFETAADVLPADTEIAAGVDMKAVRATSSLGVILQIALGMSTDIRSAVDSVKKTCSIDVVQAVDGVSIGVDANTNAALFVNLTGVTKPQFEDCLVKMVKQMSGLDSKVTETGNEISFDVLGGTFFVAWLPGNVIAVLPTAPTDESKLQHAIGGAGALRKDAAMSGWLAMVDADPLVEAISKKAVTTPFVSFNGGMFSTTDSNSIVSGRWAADLGSADAANDAVSSFNLVLSLIESQNLPAELVRIARTVDMKARGSIVSARASASETDLTKLAMKAINP